MNYTNYLICLILSIFAFNICFGQDSIQTKRHIGMDKNISVVPIYNNGNSSCKSCECNLKNLLSSWNVQNIKNYTDIRPVSYKLIDTLKDSSNIKYYFNKMANEHKYFLLYDSDSKLLTIKQRKNMVSSGDKEAFEKLKRIIESNLKLNSTIYAIKVRLKNGTTFYDYAICDTAKHHISFDDMFYFLWLTK